MSAIEYRFVQPGGELTVEDSAKASGGRTLRGYAAIWGHLSSDLGGFRELIRPGAFASTIKNGDARALWNHESKYVLGRKSAGTLKLAEDAKGLLFTIHPPATGWAKDLMTSVARKDISQMSFGFTVDVGGDTWSRPKGRPVRELLSVTLMEISVVSWPAYQQTEVHVREETNAEILSELARRRERIQQLMGA